MIAPKTRQIAIDIIAATFCEGPAGTCTTVGGILAERIVKNLEAGGFNFESPPKASENDDADPTHKRRNR